MPAPMDADFRPYSALRQHQPSEYAVHVAECPRPLRQEQPLAMVLIVYLSTLVCLSRIQSHNDAIHGVSSRAVVLTVWRCLEDLRIRDVDLPTITDPLVESE